MRRAVVAIALLPLGLLACGGGSPQEGATPAPTASASPDGASGALTGEACRALTASDVQNALGITVSQLPLTSQPPGGGPGGTLVSGCTYTSAAAAPGGASLYLFKDLAIDYFGNVPGFKSVPDAGDAAFTNGRMVIGRKGHLTFQITLESSLDQARTDQVLRTLAHSVAGRL